MRERYTGYRIRKHTVGLGVIPKDSATLYVNGCCPCVRDKLDVGIRRRRIRGDENRMICRAWRHT